MKRFSCGDVVPGCKAVFYAATEREILNAVAEHARHDHDLQAIPESLVSRVRMQIVDAPAA